MTRSITVCIPWRAQETRIGPYKKVRAFWEATGWPIIEADSAPGKRFNLAQARNNAVRQATSSHLIVTDADVLPDMSCIIDALDEIDEHVIWPYTRHKYIANDWDGDPFQAPAVQVSGLSPQPPDGFIGWTGGIYVAAVQSYWRVGGFDERFTRWGGEDSSFRSACNTLVGVGRTEGTCISFDHINPGRDATAPDPAISALQQQYRDADLHPLAMLQLTRSPERFLPQ